MFNDKSSVIFRNFRPPLMALAHQFTIFARRPLVIADKEQHAFIVKPSQPHSFHDIVNGVVGTVSVSSSPGASCPLSLKVFLSLPPLSTSPIIQSPYPIQTQEFSLGTLLHWPPLVTSTTRGLANFLLYMLRMIVELGHGDFIFIPIRCPD